MLRVVWRLASFDRNAHRASGTSNHFHAAFNGETVEVDHFALSNGANLIPAYFSNLDPVRLFRARLDLSSFQ